MGEITREEALKLIDEPLELLAKRADALRQENLGSSFDLCTIINGKSGRCSEDCKFCAQSAHYKGAAEEYELLDEEEVLKQARYNYSKGVLRYSIVTSGKRLSPEEVDKAAKLISCIRDELPQLKVCGSFGLLDKAAFEKLRDAGLSRVHNNLETSERYFDKICTTHKFQEKVEAIEAAQQAGLSLCSGGIFGLGETMEDRIDMAFALRDLGIKSVPINLLNPIEGTPLENNKILSTEELERIVAIYRIILPDASIRLAGGRGLLADKGEGCFKSGANAAITGDMLTTSGITIDSDLEILKKLGYEVSLQNEK